MPALCLQRANYVLGTVFSSPQISGPDLDDFCLFGWQRSGTDTDSMGFLSISIGNRLEDSFSSDEEL